MILDELRTYIIGYGGSFSAANTFIDFMPATPTDAIMIAFGVDSEVSDGLTIIRRDVDIFVRRSNFSNAVSWCEELETMLHDKQHISSEIKYIKILEATKEQGIGEKEESVFSLTFQLITVRS